MLNQNLLLAGDDGYNISRSLRFRGASVGSLVYKYYPITSGADTSYQIKTHSFWFKRGKLGTIQILYGNNYDSSVYWEFYINASDQLVGSSYYGLSIAEFVTAQVFRDTSAWYHCVVAVDNTSATPIMRLYINGSQVTSFASISYGSQNAYQFSFLRNPSSGDYIMAIGCLSAFQNTYNFDGYITEVNCIDGQALTASSFGQFDSQTGVWKPKKYTGTYGNNGFYLDFADNSSTTTLGYDRSGNGNNFSTANISLTAGTTYDSMTDVPTLTSATTANYCVLNPLDKATSFSVTGGNLNFAPANTSDLYSCRSTIQIPSTGKWIWEVTNTNSAYMITAGLLNGSTPTTGQQTVSCAGMTVGSIGTFFSTTQWMNTTTSWSVTNIGNGDTLVIAYDADAGKIWFGRVASGGSTVTFYNTSGTADPSTGTDPRASGIVAGGWFAGFGTYFTPSGASANFGQRPFAFTNTPTGFVSLNTFNLPEPSIVAGNKQMDATTYTGTGSNLTITNAGGFQPDFVWTKSRSNGSTNHLLEDVIRGPKNSLLSNGTNSELARGINAFLSNGFSFNDDGAGDGNVSGQTYVGWQWKANGTAVTNTAGTISSQVSANTTAGFSVVTYTGTGSAATIGHGLGAVPRMVIVKARNNARGWAVYHGSLANTQALVLNSTSAVQTQPNFWNSTSPTSTVFSIGTDDDTGFNGRTYVAYCWSQIAGYSAFGSYTGNGSTDGTFVYTGFRPKFVLLKSSTQATDWYIYDTSRDTYNLATLELNPNLAAAEQNGTYGSMDINSNGFKLRFAGGEVNVSNQTYIYMAFAENPFKNSLAR